MLPYDQRRRDPATFFFSLALIAGLFTLGTMVASEWGWAAIGLAVTVALGWRARTMARIAANSEPR